MLVLFAIDYFGCSLQQQVNYIQNCCLSTKSFTFVRVYLWWPMVWLLYIDITPMYYTTCSKKSCHLYVCECVRFDGVHHSRRYAKYFSTLKTLRPHQMICMRVRCCCSVLFYRRSKAPSQHIRRRTSRIDEMCAQLGLRMKMQPVLLECATNIMSRKANHEHPDIPVDKWEGRKNTMHYWNRKKRAHSTRQFFRF